MQTIHILPIFILVLCVNSLTANMDSKALSLAVTKFSAKFCNELAKDKSVVSSPLSAEFVLALLALGTTDPAHTELLSSLGIPSDDAIRSSFSSVSSKIKSIKGITLNVANKVYVMKGGYDLQPALKSDAEKVFDASFEIVDFAQNVAAAQLINKWVEDRTNNKIKDLISPDVLNDDSRLVLVNAIYFKGTWAKQFNKDFTQELPFNVNSKTQVNVPMMFQKNTFHYGESKDLNAQLLQLGYVGDEAKMLVVLPNEIEGLDDVMKKLAAGYNLFDDVAKMYSTKVEVTIPKFKIETEIDLNVVLPKLGIKAIFDPTNSGLTKVLNANEPLYVSKAIQKAFIEVNEEGAEAAAATAMVATFCSAIIQEVPDPRFYADRPFLAVILLDGTFFFLASYRGDQQ